MHNPPVDYRLEDDGAYTITNYDNGPAFCSFLPGVAGLNGVPLWCFYVNRAQAVVSFGVHNKDNAIAEFLPATWAYQLVGVQGFRTFVRHDGNFFEPFSTATSGDHIQRRMRIHPDALEVHETDAQRNLAFDVTYFSPPDQPLGMLVRRVRVTNTGNAPATLEILDGLPLVVPAGVGDFSLKALRHIREAYAYVRMIQGVVPYFATKVAVHDEAEVQAVAAGNFYAAYRITDRSLEPIKPYVDPHAIFGGGRDLVTPRHFIARGFPHRELELFENRFGCALAPLTLELAPGESAQWLALIGAAPHMDAAERGINAFKTLDRFNTAAEASRRCVTATTDPAFTVSSQPLFDAYARQNYLDNVLRGGVPKRLPSANGDTLLHPFARRHGDLERDYNYYILPPHPLSAGAGNYRDVLQNRRYDVWFYPEVGDLEIRAFLNLLQADGYNPLQVAGAHWRAPADLAEQVCPPAASDAARAQLARLMQQPIQPGALLGWLNDNGVEISDRDAWLLDVLSRCEHTFLASGHEGGYWIDHWTYLVDLLEAFAGLYPDRVRAMLTQGADIAWFDEGALVMPREATYQHRPSGPLQLDAVTDHEPRTPPLPATTPFGKLGALVAIKAVSFDAALRGIEMEAGRPGWNDAMNGLPGLFGSSSCEAAELARLAGWLRRVLPDPPDTLLPAPVASLMETVADELAHPYDWRRSATIRETYRAALRESSAAKAVEVSAVTLERLLNGAERRGRTAVANAQGAQHGLVHTYFRNNPRGVSRDDARPVVEQVSSFESAPLPLFLEGQVHAMRLASDPADVQRTYDAVRRSGLYDEQLAMYKLNECLDACGPDIGRARTFTRGWFENESIWMHMSYKYLLELLRAGLYDAFYADIQTMLTPFMDPHTYGRSVLENSSFIGSSANPDPATHGRGFIARLSGSSAEFVHMWLIMTIGPEPFTLTDDHALRFSAGPALPGDWFLDAPRTIHWRDESVALAAGDFACALFGDMLLIYHNPGRRSTFGDQAVRPVRYQLDDQTPVEAVALTGDAAHAIRNRQVKRVRVTLA